MDPLGGSWFIESMTNEMESRIEAITRQLEAEGGIVEAVSEGRVQAEVNRQAFERERKIQSGEVKKVGVNCFVEEEEAQEVEFHPYRREEAEVQMRRLQEIRSSRDAGRVERALGEVEKAASGDQNVMPAVMDAVEAYATVGEVCGALERVFGRFQEPVRF